MHWFITLFLPYIFGTIETTVKDVTKSLETTVSISTHNSHVDECTKEDKECHPEQIHFAFTESPNGIIVTWSTIKDTKQTLLEYWPVGKPHVIKVEGIRKLFTDGGSKRLNQTIHRAMMENLDYNTSYEYRVGSDYGMSETLSFKTVPEGDRWEVRALIFGDLGVQNGVSMPYLIKEALKGHYDVAFLVGDLAYNMDEENGTRGNVFMNQIQPLAAKLPLMVCPGNHENAYNYSNYRNRFSMPHYQKYENYFYSFNLGPIHFVSINTEAYYDNDKYPAGIPLSNQAMRIQYEWLENDLKEANEPNNRTKRPWIFVYGHRPMLCTNSLPADQCRDGEYSHRVGIPKLGGYGLEVLLKNYGVDLAIWAHEHSYERMWPVYNKTVYNGSLEHPYTNPRAPVHFTSGCAGNREGHDGFFDDPDEWSAFRSSDFGYTRLHSYNATHLYFEQLSTEKARTGTLEDPLVIDSFWVIKDVHKPYDNL